MSRNYVIFFSLAIALIFVSVLWQVMEPQILSVADKAAHKLFKRPFHQVTIYDDDGIIMQNYNKHGNQYNPLFIANEALTQNLYRKAGLGDESFIKHTNWLINNVVVNDSVALMQYKFDYPDYNLKAPWSSALTQSVAMNAIAVRAAADRDEDTYLIAQKMLYSLKPGVAGLSVALSDSNVWFMEYPAEEPYFVLDGMLGTLIKLHDYHDLTHDPLAGELFDKGFNALAEKLPEFDYRGYAYYHLGGLKAGRAYNQRYITQLEKLLEVRYHPTLMIMRNRWLKYDGYPVIWQMIMNPRPKRILAFSLAFLATWALTFVLLARTQRKEPDDPEHS
ncbi:MAG: hypothetical protein GX106_04290 [Candidatus Cloacimonetes bacterium]|nr:hypothetical protein [Candidatus Cloacimonadota bacterium]